MGATAFEAVLYTLLFLLVVFLLFLGISLMSRGIQRLADRLMVAPVHGGRARRASVRPPSVAVKVIEAETIETPREYQAPRELEA